MSRLIERGGRIHQERKEALPINGGLDATPLNEYQIVEAITDTDLVEVSVDPIIVKNSLLNMVHPLAEVVKHVPSVTHISLRHPHASVA